MQEPKFFCIFYRICGCHYRYTEFILEDFELVFRKFIKKKYKFSEKSLKKSGFCEIMGTIVKDIPVKMGIRKIYILF